MQGALKLQCGAPVLWVTRQQAGEHAVEHVLRNAAEHYDEQFALFDGFSKRIQELQKLAGACSRLCEITAPGQTISRRRQ